MFFQDAKCEFEVVHAVSVLLGDTSNLENIPSKYSCIDFPFKRPTPSA